MTEANLKPSFHPESSNGSINRSVFLTAQLNTILDKAGINMSQLVDSRVSKGTVYRTFHYEHHKGVSQEKFLDLVEVLPADPVEKAGLLKLAGVINIDVAGNGSFVQELCDTIDGLNLSITQGLLFKQYLLEQAKVVGYAMKNGSLRQHSPVSPSLRRRRRQITP